MLHFREFCETYLTEAEIPKTSYGYWITPQGEFIVVREFEHATIIGKYLENTMGIKKASYTKAFRLGFIRVLYHVLEKDDSYYIGLDFDPKTTTKQALRAADRLANFNHVKGWDIDASGFDISNQAIDQTSVKVLHRVLNGFISKARVTATAVTTQITKVAA